MVVHLFLNNNKALDFLPINSIKNGGITERPTVLSISKEDSKTYLLDMNILVEKESCIELKID